MKSLGLVSLALTTVFPFSTSTADSVEYIGTISNLIGDGAADALGFPPLLVGDDIEMLVDIELDSVPNGTVRPNPPGYVGTIVDYDISGSISALIGEHQADGSVSSLTIADNVARAGEPLQDSWSLGIEVGGCVLSGTIGFISSTDTQFDGTEFFLVNDVAGWDIRSGFLLTGGEWSGASCQENLDYFIVGDIESTGNQDAQAIIDQLVSDIIDLNLERGVSNSLDGKLQSVLRVLDDMNSNNDVAAIASLYAFISYVEAQRGRMLAEETACDLIESAEAAIVALGGSSSGSTCLIP